MWAELGQEGHGANLELTYQTQTLLPLHGSPPLFIKQR